jgi:hypothetical protein
MSPLSGLPLVTAAFLSHGCRRGLDDVARCAGSIRPTALQSLSFEVKLVRGISKGRIKGRIHANKNRRHVCATRARVARPSWP